MSLLSEIATFSYTKNVGWADRLIRVLVLPTAIVLHVMNLTPLWLSLTLGVVGVILLITGLVGKCPIYRGIGVSTAKKG
jgi:hypothetical protein